METNRETQTKPHKLRRFLSRAFLGSRLPDVPEDAAPAMPPTLPPVAASPSLLEQVDEAIARIEKTNPQILADANKATIRDRADDAYLMALEKTAMDAKVAELKAAHNTYVHQADFHRLGSRWSPDSSATSASTHNPIDDIPSDEEPEICEVDVAICYPVKTIAPGTVKVVGTGPPALNKRQREEKARLNVEKTASGQETQAPAGENTNTLEQTLHRKLSISDLRRGNPQSAPQNSSEPFPAYADHFETEERKTSLAVPRDDPYISTRAWVNRHRDVSERPQSDAFNLDVLADRAIPPADPHQSSFTTPRVPPKSPKRAPPIQPMMPLRTPPPPPIPIKSAYRQSSLPSPTAVPLPASPNPPFLRAPIRGKPLSPFARSPLATSVMSSMPSPIQNHGQPRKKLPVVGPSAPLPRSSSLQALTSQHCEEGAHTFSPIDLNAARRAISSNHTGTEHVDPCAHCEKCGLKAEVCMQCEVPVCKLVLCFDCAYKMQKKE